MLLCPDYLLLTSSVARSLGTQHLPPGQRFTLCPGMAVGIDEEGRIAYLGPADQASWHWQRQRLALPDRLLLPGLVNCHSHAPHRLLLPGGPGQASAGENFWGWRQQLQTIDSQLDPAGLYVCARHLFIESLLSGVTSVGEFHYLHHSIEGTPYANRSAMAMALARAALDSGIRLCLLRVFSLANDVDSAAGPQHSRCIDASLERAWYSVEDMVREVRRLRDPRLAWGLAAEGVQIDDLVAMKTCAAHLPLHIHAGRKQAEVDACLAQSGYTPVTLLGRRGVLDSMTTVVHPTHLRGREAEAIASLGAKVCISPTTRADSGGGFGAVSELRAHGATLALGTDGQVGRSVAGEAQRLATFERLRSRFRRGEKANLTTIAEDALHAATLAGGAALDLEVGCIKTGAWADMVAVDTYSPSLRQVDDDGRLAAMVFHLRQEMITDVLVAGEFVVRDRQHATAAAAASDFTALRQRFFPGVSG